MSMTVIHVGQTPFTLLDIDGRPWVAVEPLCSAIGINAATQTKRLQRYQRAKQLELTTAQFPDAVYLAVPLEELSFFLRSCRPQSDDAKRAIATLAPLACHSLWWHWFNHVGTYMSAADLKGSLQEAFPSVRTPPPPPRTRLCIEDAERMREMRANGHSLSQIAHKTGFSKSTVSMVCGGKYPIALKHRRRLDSETC